MEIKRNLDDVEIYASDVYEAIEIAGLLKENKGYDLFRGQTQNWPLLSSIARPDIDQEEEIKRLNKFANWVDTVRELQSVNGNYDKIAAIAQHYGIRTTFIDFSHNPKVAGFFATHNISSKRDQNEMGVIICLNKILFEKSWKNINAKFKHENGIDLTRIIDLEVNNLWRLQTQEGVFLDTRAAPDLLEMFSFFKYIHFPHTGKDFELINEHYIYPKNKSHLEILIDEFFENDSREKGTRYVEEVLGLKRMTFGQGFRGDESVFIANKFPEVHESWNRENMKNWESEPSEKVDDNKQKINFSFKLGTSLTASEQKDHLYKELHNIEKLIVDVRTYSINWEIKDENGNILTMNDEDRELFDDGTSPQIECSEIVARLWNGLRRLPYSNEQIYDCISNFLIASKYRPDGSDVFLGKQTGVEFSTNIAINRASASDELLFAAVRDDFWDLIKEEKKDEIFKDGYELLSILIDPTRLFDFKQFADLFVRNVIPLQPLFSSYDRIIFSAARISTFGLS